MAKQEQKKDANADASTNTANASKAGENSGSADAGATNANASTDADKKDPDQNDAGKTDAAITDQDTKSQAAAGDDKDFEKSFTAAREQMMFRPAMACQPVVYLPGKNDETCRHNGANELLAFVTAVADEKTINLQAIPDGGAMQWRTSIKHQSIAKADEDAWKNHEEETIDRSGKK